MGYVFVGVTLCLELTMQLSYSFSIFSAFVVGFFAAIIGTDLAKYIESKFLYDKQEEFTKLDNNNRDPKLDIKD